MLNLNRKTEYGLMALEYMQQNTQEERQLFSTREIAESCQIPLPILAKIMQKFSGRGLIQSVQGTNGGYYLAKKPEDISLLEVLEILEGGFALADCFKSQDQSCPRVSNCTIRGPLLGLQKKFYDLLTETKVSQLKELEATAL